MDVLVSNFDKAKQQFDPKIAIAAMNAALNKAIVTVRKETSKQITSEYAIKARDIKKTMSVQRSNFNTLTSQLTSADVRLALSLFNPTQKREGVTVKVKKKQPRQILKHAFVATMKSGHVGVFTTYRKTIRKVRRRKGVPRRGPLPNRSELPIDEAITVAVPQMWDIHASELVAKARVPVVFTQEMNYRLSRAAKR